MRNIRLVLEYRGTAFHGWQRQSALRTVQGELEKSLSTILREPITVRGAGRTDAGVHALGQVANFRTTCDLPLERIVRGVNALGRGELCVRDAGEAEEGFDARRSASARHYVYLLLARPSPLWAERAWHPRAWPDAAAMNAAAGHLVGEHDFAAFSCASADEGGTRTHVLYARWEPWPRGLAFRIGAVRFLYKMVRGTVGLCLEVGLGRLEPEEFRRSCQEPRGRVRTVVPPHGLHLVAVDYAGGARAAGGRDCPPAWPVL